ncbi:heavy metal-associated domain-containing protein [Neisseria bacilliformis]|uniref:heavy-metal-associated domain-containing protein n=1 Tax=Neisseria bacilliformis TaxID=267212 RepID=UPI0028E95DAE|nr:heavy metal-associated domain-containing protein [Neisseria bacilliformis]
METVTLNIGGMTCGGCVKSVTRILEGADGVKSVQVSLDEKKAVVSYDPAATSPTALAEAVEDGGYDASF